DLRDDSGREHITEVRRRAAAVEHRERGRDRRHGGTEQRGHVPRVEALEGGLAQGAKPETGAPAPARPAAHRPPETARTGPPGTPRPPPPEPAPTPPPGTAAPRPPLAAHPPGAAGPPGAARRSGRPPTRLHPDTIYCDTGQYP